MLNINDQFKDKTLYQTAMTHSSYANEHRGSHLHHNERLEFLGDSVLGFVTADYLFTHYPDLPEGDLTKLRAAVVCEGALCEIARELGIPQEIRLGHGEETGGGRERPSILADATEALLGAIYLDGGYAAAQKFLARTLTETDIGNYKTALQEFVQQREHATPVYQTREEGDEFVCEVHALGANACGRGASKKLAEQAAAKLLIGKLTKQ